MLNLPQKKHPLTLRSKTPLLMLLACVSFGSLGCRSTTDNQIDLLERELRTQEDYIYELEDYVVEYSEKLRDARCACPPQTAVYTEQYEDIEPAPKYTEEKPRRKSSKEKSVVEKKSKDNLPAPKLPKADSPEVSPEDIEVPELDFEIEDSVSYQESGNPLRQTVAAEPANVLRGRRVVMIPDPVDFESDEEFTVEPEDPTDTEDTFANDEPLTDDVTEEYFEDDKLEQTLPSIERIAERVEVTQLFRGGEAASQSLLAVVEALDMNNEPVDLDGEVSLMVMTNDEESPQRVKRWNFNAEETTAAWQSSDLGDGLHLELPLEQVELPADTVELWVRLVTTDGRKLLTQLPFDAEQLVDVESYLPPEPIETGLVLAETETVESDVFETETIESSQNNLRLSSKRHPAEQQIELAKATPKKEKPRWRASMQRTDRTAVGFATSSETAKGWIAQPLSRQQKYAPATAASHKVPVATPKKPAKKPASSSWNSSRY